VTDWDHKIHTDFTDLFTDFTDFLDRLLSNGSSTSHYWASIKEKSV
jgi:hypothetical protein